MKKNSIIGAMLALGLAMGQGAAMAEGFQFDQSKAYVGGGLGYNSVGDPWDKAIGWQIFGGYELDQVKLGENIASAVEVGYMNSGKFKYSQTIFGTTLSSETSASGLWATYVATYTVNDQWDALGRVGLDFGDDSGLMFGFGGEYKLSDNGALRVEYVVRDSINSFQGNYVHRF